MQLFLQSKFVSAKSRGSYCIGSSFDQRSCISRTACIGTPINGRWTSWSEWSQCSDPYGHRSRMRFCSNPRPSEGDFQRVGSDFEITSCDDISRLFHSQDRTWTE
ncbi:Uncharacterized protein BM_BM1900 [Brugia malayi]|uniref:Uncharacterized protein n=1 Tax=Brugia malayi TaxID=6279 RepID=A0A4E9EUR8_BRUMA|nr:Uncharacterized protein BM_BM1900 [Brugia malayi]VIO88001.1 Uncharacterized protein BM_BM1900 [Brugia malayi]